MGIIWMVVELCVPLLLWLHQHHSTVFLSTVANIHWRKAARSQMIPVPEDSPSKDKHRPVEMRRITATFCRAAPQTNAGRVRFAFAKAVRAFCGAEREDRKRLW